MCMERRRERSTVSAVPWELSLEEWKKRGSRNGIGEPRVGRPNLPMSDGQPAAQRETELGGGTASISTYFKPHKRPPLVADHVQLGEDFASETSRAPQTTGSSSGPRGGPLLVIGLHSDELGVAATDLGPWQSRIRARFPTGRLRRFREGSGRNGKYECYRRIERREKD